MSWKLEVLKWDWRFRLSWFFLWIFRISNLQGGLFFVVFHGLLLFAAKMEETVEECGFEGGWKREEDMKKLVFIGGR